MKGKVYLVGAGPGDPGLLTLRGREVLAGADAVLYDALADPRLLAFAPAAAERILVGKRHGRTSMEQAAIEAMLVDLAGRGKSVVRLKGGDPFIFGRGGEEAEACRRAGIDFEVVPGVTSAIAAPAYAGVPLTHREHSSVVTFVTGQPGSAKDRADIDWELLARTRGTLVFLMAMTRIGEIAARLMAGGLAPSTPAAAVRWGTLPRQRSVFATLETIAEEATRILERPPVVFVVGDVAGLGDSLSWFERLPLFGRRIVVTRARHQAAALTERLERAGAEVISCPTIEVQRLAVAPEHYQRLGEYRWLILTSVNGVEAFFDGFLAAGRDLRELAGVALAAIGPATRAAIEARGLRVAAEPSEYRAEALLETLGDVAGARVLLARAEVAREVLPQSLRERGAKVDVLPLYRTVLPSDGGKDVAAELGDFDLIAFTSSSTATNFDRLCGGSARALLEGRAVAAIGPITAETLASLSIHVDVMPAKYTIEALAEAIEAYFANRPGVS